MSGRGFLAFIVVGLGAAHLTNIGVLGGAPAPGAAPSPAPAPGAPAAAYVPDDGSTLSGPEIEALWIAHGGDPGQAHVAQAVARAESGGRPGAVSPPNYDGSIDRGLFQMNSIHGSCSTTDLQTNVQCAVDLQRRGTWSHWTTYTSGKYRAYL